MAIKFTEERRLNAVKLYQEGKSVSEVEQLTSISSNYVKDPVSYMIRSYKQGATKRNLDFLLTREEFESFIYRKCYYCDAGPSSRSVSTNCTIICNGIDREDNNKGYYKGNCVPACQVCNVMKSTMGHEEFIQHCRRIAKRFVDAN